MCFSLWPTFGKQDLTLRKSVLFLKCEHSALSVYILNTERLPCTTHTQSKLIGARVQLIGLGF